MITRPLVRALLLAALTAAGGCDFKVNATGSAVAGQAPGYLRTAVPALSVALGESKLLDPFISTADGVALKEKLVWSSSAPDVVTIEAGSSQATARKLGSAVLTASLPSAPDQKVTITMNVVAETSVKSIQIEPASFQLEIGQSRGLTAAVRLADGQVNGNVQWASSDATIAVVDAAGKVSALRLGRVTVIATYALDAQFKGVAELNVLAAGALATPTPSPTPTPVPTPTPTPKPSRTPRPSAAPTEAPAATPTPTPTATATPAATPTPEPTATATPTPTPSPTATPAG